MCIRDRIFNLKPSKEVGFLKDAVREAILDGDIENDFKAALDFVIKKGKEIGLIQTHDSI